MPHGMEHRWLEDPGWRGKVGFISPPSMSLDPTEFMKIAPPGFRVCQTMTYVPGFANPNASSRDNIASAAEQLEACSVTLQQAGVDIIAQSGTPFAFVQGGFTAGQALQNHLEQVTGIPVAMMGMSVVSALKSAGLGSVAAACTYYDDDVIEGYTQFLEDAGIKVLGMENWVSQGLLATQQEVRRLTHPLHTRLTIGLVYKAAKMVARNNPDAECIILSGGAISTMDVLQALEEDLGKPVISSMSALCWEIFDRLDVHAPISGYGSVLAALGNGTSS